MLKKSELAGTGILVSPLGLGTVKFGRNQGVKYPTHFELPTNKEISDLLSCAQSLGINLLDTAPAYGLSEERLGTLLKGARHDWVICDKAGEDFTNGKSHFDFSPKAVCESVEKSLQRLNTDYLDILLIHSNGEDTKIIIENNIFEVLADLKKSGKVRAYGMSTKTVEGGLLTVKHADLAMVTYNPLQSTEREVIVNAYKQNKGILIKKAFASGHLQTISEQTSIKEDPAYIALKYVFSEPGVNSVILGTLNKKHLTENVYHVNEILKNNEVS